MASNKQHEMLKAHAAVVRLIFNTPGKMQIPDKLQTRREGMDVQLVHRATSFRVGLGRKGQGSSPRCDFGGRRTKREGVLPSCHQP